MEETQKGRPLKLNLRSVQTQTSISLDKKIKNLDLHLKTWASREQSLLGQRLSLGGLSFLSLIFVAVYRDSFIPLALFVILISGFSILVGRHRRISDYLQRLQTLKAFFERQALRLQGQSVAPLRAENEAPRPDIPNVSDEESELQVFPKSNSGKSLLGLFDESFSDEGYLALIERLRVRAEAPKTVEELQSNILADLKNFKRLKGFLLLGQKSKLGLRISDLKRFLTEPCILPEDRSKILLHGLFWPLGVLASLILGSPWPMILYAMYSLSTLSLSSRAYSRAQYLEVTLKNLKALILYLDPKTSVVFLRQIKKLSFFVSGMSTQNHWLVHILINLIFPWSPLFSILTERWRSQSSGVLQSYLDQLVETEVRASLAVFAKYQSSQFSRFSQDGSLKVKDLFHPLIPRDQVVANSLEVEKGSKLLLLTGSNMSGKSTFLKTLGLNQILAQAGLPVFANLFETQFFKVMTCLSRHDSLDEGYSTFYAEVKKVKEILDCVDRGEAVFYLIDEIFRGTNNRERYLGSLSVIQKLLEKPKALGLISTHDLELSKLSETNASILNFHFRDDFSKDQLVFSYQIQAGPCPTTNALKIMQLMGLPVPSSPASS